MSQGNQITALTVANPAIALYNNVNPIEFINMMVPALRNSMMWGEIDVNQATMILFEAMGRGYTCHQLKQRYHLMMGQLSKKTEAALADFQTKFGGRLETIVSTKDEVHVKATCNGITSEVRWTWDELLKEPFVYDTKEKDAVAAISRGQHKTLRLKPKYGTDRSRTNMMWLRAAEWAVKRVCPAAMLDCMDLDYGDSDAIDVEATPVPQDSPQPASQSAPSQPPAEEATFEPKQEAETPATEMPQIEPENESAEPATEERVQYCRSLLGRVMQRPGCSELCKTFAAKVRECCGSLNGMTLHSLESCIDYLTKLDVDNPSPDMEEASKFFEQSLRRYEPKN